MRSSVPVLSWSEVSAGRSRGQRCDLSSDVGSPRVTRTSAPYACAAIVMCVVRRLTVSAQCDLGALHLRSEIAARGWRHDHLTVGRAMTPLCFRPTVQADQPVDRTAPPCGRERRRGGTCGALSATARRRSPLRRRSLCALASSRQTRAKAQSDPGSPPVSRGRSRGVAPSGARDGPDCSRQPLPIYD